MIDPGPENILAAHRHTLHALEDFTALEARMKHSPMLMKLYGPELRTISHHLRHA